MVTVRLSLLLVAALCSIGCVVSTNDLVGPNGEGATFDPKLLGDWIMTDAETESEYEEEFARVERKAPDSNTYVIWFFGVPKPKVEGEKSQPVKDEEALEAHLVKIGDRLFLTFPRPLGNDANRRYDFIKIDRMDSELIGSTLNMSYLRKHPEIVPHRVEGTGTSKLVTLTATTEELREFVAKHVNVAAAWEEPSTLGHRRAAEPVSTSENLDRAVQAESILPRIAFHSRLVLEEASWGRRGKPAWEELAAGNAFCRDGLPTLATPYWQSLFQKYEKSEPDVAIAALQNIAACERYYGNRKLAIETYERIVGARPTTGYNTCHDACRALSDLFIDEGDIASALKYAELAQTEYVYRDFCGVWIGYVHDTIEHRVLELKDAIGKGKRVRLSDAMSGI